MHGQLAKLTFRLGHSPITDHLTTSLVDTGFKPWFNSFRACTILRKTQKIQRSIRREENHNENSNRVRHRFNAENTEKVAQTISEVLKAKGQDVDCKYVNDADPASVKNYDLVLAGAPTQALRATKPIMEFLDKLGRGEFAGKPAAAFDTQLQAWWSGNAAEGIEKKLRNLGFKIIMPPLVTYVEGKTEQVHLKDGELEKAKKYAEDLANRLQK